MGAINWFLVANTFLTAGAGVWYIVNGQTWLGILQLNFTLSNIIFLIIGMK